MTVVNIDLTQPSGRGDGTAVPARGQVTFTPSRRTNLQGAVVLPAPIVVRLRGGHATVDLQPNNSQWYWRVQEAIPYGRRRNLSIPAGPMLEYEELPEIDPASFEEVPETPPPGWYAAIDDQVVDGFVDQAGRLVLRQRDGDLIVAGDVGRNDDPDIDLVVLFDNVLSSP